MRTRNFRKEGSVMRRIINEQAFDKSVSENNMHPEVQNIFRGYLQIYLDALPHDDQSHATAAFLEAKQKLSSRFSEIMKLTSENMALTRALINAQTDFGKELLSATE